MIPPEASSGTGRQPANPLGRLANLIGSHIVQQYRLGAISQHGIEFFQRADFDFHLGQPRRLSQRAFQRLDHAPGERNVIVLDQHSIAEIETMIMAATAALRRIVEQAQPGRGFARIQNDGLGAFHGVDIRRVRVAMPLIRCMMFRITRSQERMTRAL